MGVYINIEMPRTHPITVEIYPGGMVLSKTVGRMDIHGEAVPVPPHGRCVDADKLMQEMRLFIKENMLSRDDAREILETIDDAPTVLVAEEVYGQYTDTAGNFHWCGTHSGEHTFKEEGE